MKCDDDLFVDFVDQCLEWKIEKRMTPEQAFQHPWIKAGIIELKQKIDQQQQQQQYENQQKLIEASSQPNSIGYGNRHIFNNNVSNDKISKANTDGGSNHQIKKQIVNQRALPKIKPGGV